MAGKIATRTGLSALTLAVALTGGTTSAGAEQYLFDMLFGRNKAARQHVEPASPPEPQTTGAVRAVPKISSPSYYNYAPEALVKMDLASLAAALEGDEAERADTDFAQAIALLTDFELLAEKKIGAALVEHYSENPDFIWVDESGPNERAKAVLDVLAGASDFGLRETDYVVNPPSLDEPGVADERMAELARFELTLSARALRYARDARLGRVNPNKLSGYHDFPAKPLDEHRVLKVLAGTPLPARYLEALHPRNELYAALREELKALRASAEREIVVDLETFVRPGESHSEFPKILQIIERDADAAFLAEYGDILAAHRGSETFARELVPVIKAAQKLHELNPDGVIGRRTIGALAGESRATRIEKVLLALERLRWHPSYLGSTRVMINVPSFTASFIKSGEERLSMRAVAGTRANQTSFFYDKIEYVEYNPYWGVPRSILVNEKLPQLIRDPGYLDRAGYEVTDARGRRIPSAAINWAAYGSNIPFSVRQKPGPANALGELKIMFPNKHDIYMHDTPAKNLFARDTRAFSHGCVRLQEPRAMAAAVLRVSEEEVARRIAQGRNARQDVPEEIPVYVGYFTAWPEPDGSGISYHPDIYGRDAHLQKALQEVEKLRAPGS